MHLRTFGLCFFLALSSAVGAADLSLPDPLTMADGRRATNPEMWRSQRRGEILRLYEGHIFGRIVQSRAPALFEVLSTKTDALGGLATRKNIRIHLMGRKPGPWVDFLLYIPNGAKAPVPAFIGLNFLGNQSITSEPDVPVTTGWVHDFKGVPGLVNHRATEATRAIREDRWPLEMIVKRGYAIGTAHYGEIEADSWAWARASVLQHVRDPDASGAICAWAFGLRRALDYLEQEPAVDAKRVAVTGHSRLGKTALWAGAQDERFALVVSNCSGEGGASIARTKVGERISAQNRNSFWYAARYADYDGREEALPVDSHFLISLIAPRPVYVCSATEDVQADPEGEFLGARSAGPVYALFGLAGLGVNAMPPPDKSVGGHIGYHVRTGVHDHLPADWALHLDFADRHFKQGAATGRR